jgi:hypothetical protein
MSLDTLLSIPFCMQTQTKTLDLILLAFAFSQVA